MKKTVSADGEAGQQEDAGAAGKAGAAQPRVRRCWAAAVVLVLVVLGAGVGIAWPAGAFQSHGRAGTGRGTSPPATATVEREDLSSQTPVNATLGYARSYTVSGKSGGTLTWLPSLGRVIRQGQVLYRVDNGTPVVLLHGTVPAWRTLHEGVTGADVSQLNHDLVRLGYASRADTKALGWDYYSWETRYGVRRLEEHLGVSSPPGSLPLGSVVFEPEALRVSEVTGSLGGPASGPVLKATSDEHQVMIPLDASQQTAVKKGDRVTVTLPDGKTTPGVVSSVGRVATSSPGSSAGGSGGSSSSATIPVHVRLTHPDAAGSLDQAPVTVYITTATVHNVLVVPVGALLAQASGGYVVEVAGVGNTRRLVPVSVGTFNDNSGLVQVTGALTPGQRVVVPAT